MTTQAKPAPAGQHPHRSCDGSWSPAPRGDRSGHRRPPRRRRPRRVWGRPIISLGWLVGVEYGGWALLSYLTVRDRLSESAAVQEISRGRLVLGLGAGGDEAEFRAFDIRFDHRASRFGEAFEIIRRLLAGERVTFAGRFERVHDAVVLPRPVPPPPLMIGSPGEPVLRAALAHVDAWNVWYDSYGNTPDGFARANTGVSELVRESGRYPSDVLRSATVFVSVECGGGDRPHTLDAPPLSGPPDRIADGLAHLAAAGLDEAILVVSPITERSIRVLGDSLTLLGTTTRWHSGSSTGEVPGSPSSRVERVTASRVGPPPTGSCSTWPVSTASRWQMTGSRRLVPAPAWRRCTPRCRGTDGPFRLAAATPCLPVDRTGAGAVSLTLRQAEFGTTGTGEFVVCDGKVAIA
jgi:hypothetical protein